MNTVGSRIRFVFSYFVYLDESRYTVSVRSTVPSFTSGCYPPLVGLSGLEPPTSRLSGARSNLLSYKPMWCDSMYLQPAVFLQLLVEMMGFEPMTPCLQGRCSPNWATPPCGVYLSLKEHFVIPENRTTIAIVGFAKSRRPWLFVSTFRITRMSLDIRQFSIERRWSSRTFRYGYLVTT